MSNPRYHVSIPSWARPAFGGKKILFRRFSDKAVASAWQAKVKAQIKALRVGAEAASVGITPARDLRFSAAWPAWINGKNIAPTTKKWYLDLVGAHIDTMIGQTRVSQIGRGYLQEYIERRRRSRPPASTDALAKELMVIKSVIRWAHGEGYQIDPSALKIKKPRVVPATTRRFDPDLMERFLGAANGRDRAVLLVALYSGLRRGELRHLAVEWLRWKEGRILVPADLSFKPNGNKPRSIPLSAGLESVLKGCSKAGGAGSSFPRSRVGRGRVPTCAASSRRFAGRRASRSGAGTTCATTSSAGWPTRAGRCGRSRRSPVTGTCSRRRGTCT